MAYKIEFGRKSILDSPPKNLIKTFLTAIETWKNIGFAAFPIASFRFFVQNSQTKQFEFQSPNPKFQILSWKIYIQKLEAIKKYEHIIS